MFLVLVSVPLSWDPVANIFIKSLALFAFWVSTLLICLPVIDLYKLDSCLFNCPAESKFKLFPWESLTSKDFKSLNVGGFAFLRFEKSSKEVSKGFTVTSSSISDSEEGGMTLGLFAFLSLRQINLEYLFAL